MATLEEITPDLERLAEDEQMAKDLVKNHPEQAAVLLPILATLALCAMAMSVPDGK